MRFRYFYFLIVTLIVCLVIIMGCTEDEEGFTLGAEYLESETDITLIDTFGVKLSTVILDSVASNGTGSMLVGSYQDNITGKITSNSYFQIGIPDRVDIQDEETYDSLNLVIRYSNYSFGDTTKTQQIFVHRLLERIGEFDNDIIDKKTTIMYDPNSIGSVTYTPEPNNSPDTLSIKLSDELGLGFFNKLQEGSDILTDQDKFLDYFYGLVLIVEDTYNGAIIGFIANYNDVSLTLHTTKEVLSTEEYVYRFGLIQYINQFNNINHDFSSTKLINLTEQRNELPSDQLEGLSYLQGGIGLAVRVDFPSLSELLLFDKGTIMEAELSISPLKNSFETSDLPESLILYKSDNINRLNEMLQTNQGTTAFSSLNYDELYTENTIYTFDVTKFINDELADFYVDPEGGLLITLPEQTLSGSFNRLIIDADNINTNLKIYYLTY